MLLNTIFPNVLSRKREGSAGPLHYLPPTGCLRVSLKHTEERSAQPNRMYIGVQRLHPVLTEVVHAIAPQEVVCDFALLALPHRQQTTVDYLPPFCPVAIAPVRSRMLR